MENETTAVTILIVDGEILVANGNKERLEDLNYQVAGVASSADKALELLDKNPTIDIVISEIMLKGDRDGIELAHEINKKYDLPLIFLTSQTDSELVDRAKEVQPYAYIVKPLNDRQISLAIELALTNFAKSSPENELNSEDIFVSQENKVLQITDSLYLKKNAHFEKVVLKDFHLLKEENDYTVIHTKSNKFIHPMLLKKIEEILPASPFIRVHRSYVVNILAVTSFEGNSLYLDEMRIPVSKSHRDSVFKLFKSIT